KSCCPTTAARNQYNICRLPGTPRPVCAALSGCKIISGTGCPPGYRH
uniref:Denclatoxin-B n=1 Tax=Dendrophthora clavata TaxID=3965 RepID=THN_DENCL|nr:RecName: Full=Denclatoxin-B [Dendrophthora clavata]